MSERRVSMNTEPSGGDPLAPIRAAVWGDLQPQGLGFANFVAGRDLGRLADELMPAPGSNADRDRLLVDLGCGTGGAGLWVARRVGARLVGVDRDGTALGRAQRRVEGEFAGTGAAFVRAEMMASGLREGRVSGVLSIDAVQVAPDRAAVFREAWRLVAPGGRFAFTAWDHPRAPPISGERHDRPTVPDSRPLLEKAGFEVLGYEELPTWPDHALAFYQAVLDQRRELEPVVRPALFVEAAWAVAFAHFSSHVAVLALRPASDDA